ncbi:MAG: hydroxyacid dehydrogenase [Bacteroidetes bacterium]|nr:MAG: hydroxyacid dehydrogenase [Bacteroidota bacterium]
MKVLFIDSTQPILKERLENAGFICDYLPNLPKEEIIERIKNYEGIIIRSRIKLNKDILSKANRLKFIGRVGAGMENIDLEYAESKGIKCYNSPEGNRDAVGEHSLGMLLALFNRLCIANNEVKTGSWNREENRGFEIKGKTIGIIGYGNMGSAFAQRLKGFEVKVIAYDKYKSDFGNENVTEVQLKNIFIESDVLSLHVPLTMETEFMINFDFIDKFKKPIYIINTARGKVVKTSDLVEQIIKGKVLGAALDVLEYEKTSFENIHQSNKNKDFQFLTESNQVILSPHIAGWTHESNIKLATFLTDKIITDFGKQID